MRRVQYACDGRGCKEASSVTVVGTYEANPKPPYEWSVVLVGSHSYLLCPKCVTRAGLVLPKLVVGPEVHCATCGKPELPSEMWCPAGREACVNLGLNVNDPVIFICHDCAPLPWDELRQRLMARKSSEPGPR